MRKNVVYVKGGRYPLDIIFRYRGADGDYFLFRRKYSKPVYDYFRYGRSLEQLHRQKDWRRNLVLCRIIKNRIPAALKVMETGGAYEG